MKLAVIHTTPATIEPLKALAAEMIPGCEVLNWLDDSILPALAASGGRLEEVEPRLVQYACFAEAAGAQAILSACSSVGEVAAKMQARVRIPVVRIDEAMAVQAVRRGRRIGVAATLRTTLHPTLRLLEQKAAAAGVEAKFASRLSEAAYRALMAGDREGHDAILARDLEELAGQVDVVVLAQASMARVLPRLPEAMRDRFLASPPLAMLQVKAALEGAQP